MNLLDYIKGFRKGEEARRIEIDAMRDPFLAEALEGFDSVKGDHAQVIETMRGRVEARTGTVRRRTYKIWMPVAAVAAIAGLLLYVTVFENPQGKYTDMNTLYVYVPDCYPEKNRLREYSQSPKVEIDNMDILTPETQLEVYVPDDYVEKRKRSQRNAETEKISASSEKTPVKIANIDEIFAPEEPIDIYLPESFMTKEKQNAPPRVQIDNY